METWIIYGLRLDSSDEYRYIGLSRKGMSRFEAHLRLARRPEPQLPVHRWIAKHDGDITMDIIESAPAGEWDYLCFIERYWIKHYREQGHRLLNMTDGGDGIPGYKASDELRKARSDRWSGEGNPWHGQSRSGERNPRFGVPVQPETREKIRQHQLSDKNTWRGRKHRPETLQKMSEKRREYWTDERRAALSEVMSKPKTSEHREAMSKARKGKPSPGMHKRWHVNRGITKPDCVFCK